MNPNDGDKSHPHHADVRKELGAVIYAANVLGSRGPRKMQVAIPGVDENNEVIPFIPSGRPSTYSPPKRKSSFSLFGGGGGAEDTLSNGDDLLARIKDRNFRNLAYFINKPPRWNDQVGAYVLNFNGRVTMASVKNFQLVDPDEINDVNLQVCINILKYVCWLCYAMLCSIEILCVYEASKVYALLFIILSLLMLIFICMCVLLLCSLVV